MDLGLFQQQTLKSVMTQELQQALQILQFSKTELIQFIREKAMENPLIDLQETAYEGRSDDYEESSRHGSEGYNPFDFISEGEKGLRDDLLQQARYLNLDEPTYKRLAYVILQLDEDGYLPEYVTEETAQALHMDKMEAEELVRLLQKLEPAGVGARNLKECLLLQIDRLPETNELARIIVQDHLQPLANKKWGELADTLMVSEEEVRVAAEWIQQLHPKPGWLHEAGQLTHFIKPDLSVEKIDGRFVVILNDDFIPKIHLSHHYDHFLKNRADTETWRYMNAKRRETLWLSKCLEQRRETLLSVSKVIVNHQSGFFENGFLGLTPMTMKKVAGELGIHESTVSRAVKNKNVQTPFGLYEMRAFFTSKLKTSSGGEVSSSRVKGLIKQMIDEENARKPLSDEKISTLLNDRHGISVSRRTVAKYRGQLHIPASSKRKS